MMGSYFSQARSEGFMIEAMFYLMTRSQWKEYSASNSMIYKQADMNSMVAQEAQAIFS